VVETTEPLTGDEANQVEREMERLIALVETGIAVKKVQAKLATKDSQLAGLRAQLAAMDQPPTVVSELPTMTEADVPARLSNLWREVKLDPDRTRIALGRIFEEITVQPLDGEWENGWELHTKARPWVVLLPKGASSVAQLVGCGGRI
jgi:hypothetical protein